MAPSSRTANVGNAEQQPWQFLARNVFPNRTLDAVAHVSWDEKEKKYFVQRFTVTHPDKVGTTFQPPNNGIITYNKDERQLDHKNLLSQQKLIKGLRTGSDFDISITASLHEVTPTTTGGKSMPSYYELRDVKLAPRPASTREGTPVTSPPRPESADRGKQTVQSPKHTVSPPRTRLPAGNTREIRTSASLPTEARYSLRSNASRPERVANQRGGNGGFGRSSGGRPEHSGNSREAVGRGKPGNMRGNRVEKPTRGRRRGGGSRGI